MNPFLVVLGLRIDTLCGHLVVAIVHYCLERVRYVIMLNVFQYSKPCHIPVFRTFHHWRDIDDSNEEPKQTQEATPFSFQALQAILHEVATG